MPRWFKITLGVVATLVLCFAALIAYLIWDFGNQEWSFSNGSDAHWEARAEFLASFDGITCLTSDRIAKEAAARDFTFWQLENELNWCHRPTGLINWVGVEVMPGQMMSTLDENSEYFGFDTLGCAVAWEDASGPGTTCPDN